MVSAMLGMLAELAQYQPAFPQPNERPEQALERVRPLIVVLLDGSLDVAQSDLFFALAARRRAGIVLFGGQGNEEVASQAGARGIPWLEIPTDVQRLRSALEMAATTDWWRRSDHRRSPNEGRPGPAAERAEDGTIVYVDGDGHRWLVYDRRGHDRRQAGEASDTAEGSAALLGHVRIFVAEDGESRLCEMLDGEAESFTAEALASQFARASRV
ncbi:MAG TPA: hypothetical protein VM076_20965 [Gemmatimonadaceae bacterium]|nr:hypothetical protein [Gemmatimonadaceae bacterium]